MAKVSEQVKTLQDKVRDLEGRLSKLEALMGPQEEEIHPLVRAAVEKIEELVAPQEDQSLPPLEVPQPQVVLPAEPLPPVPEIPEVAQDLQLAEILLQDIANNKEDGTPYEVPFSGEKMAQIYGVTSGGAIYLRGNPPHEKVLRAAKVWMSRARRLGINAKLEASTLILTPAKAN